MPVDSVVLSLFSLKNPRYGLVNRVGDFSVNCISVLLCKDSLMLKTLSKKALNKQQLVRLKSS